jgi:hypothetical protein
MKLLLLIPLLFAVACEQAQPSKTDAHPNRVPVAVGETVATVEPPAPPKPPDPPKEEAKSQRQSPFYGSTFWDELLTSVYYYPKDGDGDTAMTHLKFNHRDDDIWLCGDQRRSFFPGRRVKLTVTFEPNQPCATNWQAQ